MDPFIVVTHPTPLRVEARPVDHDDVPDGHVALGYYADDRLLARGIVPPHAIGPLTDLLREPVTLALAAIQDDDGNIDGRVCVVLPFPPEQDTADQDEPWKSSIPSPPPGIETNSGTSAESPHLALLPLGNVVRSASHRHHPDVVSDLREMLDNLLAGRGRDAVARAIDDLLDSI